MTETHTFTFDQTDEDGPDVYVADVFTDGWDTRRAVLDGQTYEAKDIIKFDWETTHHEFDSQTKAWVVDEDSLDALAAELEANGFTFARDHRGGEDPLDEVVAKTDTDDRIEVTYQKKTGSGTSSYAGRVMVSEQLPDRAYIAFNRDEDGHRMRIKRNRDGRVSLFTSNSHAPFVGRVEEILVEPVGMEEVDA